MEDASNPPDYTIYLETSSKNASNYQQISSSRITLKFHMSALYVIIKRHKQKIIYSERATLLDRLGLVALWMPLIRKLTQTPIASTWKIG